MAVCKLQEKLASLFNVLSCDAILIQSYGIAGWWRDKPGASDLRRGEYWGCSHHKFISKTNSSDDLMLILVTTMTSAM